MTQNILKDVAIIGAGPVGLFAVFQCGMLGLSSAVIDSLPQAGGQCTALYPEKPIYDIPGFPDIAANDLIARLEAQASPFRPEMILGQTVTQLTRREDAQSWRLTTSSGHIIHARAIIIAAGAGAFGPNRPPLPGIESYEGKSVFYMVRHKDHFREKRIVIAGGGDSAVDWALSLAGVAASIMVVHRRDQFRAAPESVSRMRALAANGNIRMIVPSQLHGLDGSDGMLTGVIVKDIGTGEEQRLDADILLPFFGLASNLGPIAEWGLDLDRHKIVVDPVTAETNQPMIYAIGDIATYRHKLKLILTGFSEAAFAAHDIHRRMNPDKEFHMEYSTTKGVPSRP